MSRFLAGWAAAFAMLISCSGYCISILETAQFTPGSTGGSVVGSSQFVGYRFQVPSQVTTASIGATLSSALLLPPPPGNGFVFGAIVDLTGPSDLPDSLDLSTPDLLGFALLPVPAGFPGQDVVVDLRVLLEPGWYAVLFGSGLFGATGTGVLTYHPYDDLSGFPTFSANFNSGHFDWITIDAPGSFGGVPIYVRIFIDANAVPEPSSIGLLALGLLGVLATGRRAR